MDIEQPKTEATETTPVQPTNICCECGGKLIRVEWKREGFELTYDDPRVYGKPTGARWVGYSTKHTCDKCSTIVEQYHYAPKEEFYG